MREWRRLPVGTLEAVIEARAYARAKATYDATEDQKNLPRTEMMNLVREIDFDVAQEEIARRG